MNIFILGYTGFIGKKIYEFLSLNTSNNVIGISTKLVDLTKEGSYRTLQEIITPDSVLIMCAGVKKQLGDDIDIFEKNMAIINNFIRAISTVIPKKIIFFSSASIYGEDIVHHDRITEETSIQNRSYYGIAKYMSELLLDRVCSDIQTQLIILRPPLIYGEGDTSFGYGPTGFIYKMINNEEIVLWGDGSEFREFIYISDIVRIVNQLLYTKFTGVLNLVSGKSYTYAEIIQVIKNNFSIDMKVISRDRSKDKVDHHFSSKLNKEVLDNFKFTDLSSGLKLMYNSIQIVTK